MTAITLHATVLGCRRCRNADEQLELIKPPEDTRTRLAASRARRERGNAACSSQPRPQVTKKAGQGDGISHRALAPRQRGAVHTDSGRLTATATAPPAAAPPNGQTQSVTASHSRAAGVSRAAAAPETESRAPGPSCMAAVHRRTVGISLRLWTAQEAATCTRSAAYRLSTFPQPRRSTVLKRLSSMFTKIIHRLIHRALALASPGLA